MGPDGFNGQLLLQNESLMNNYSKLIFEAMNKYQLPQYLSKGRLKLLSKSSNSFPNISDTRPLIIQYHIAKIIEKVISNKLESLQSQLLQTPHHQKGFKKSNSTSQNISHILKLFHKEQGQRKRKKGILLIDLAKAFNSVDREVLFT